MKTARVLVVDVIEKRDIHKADISCLEDFYRELKCDCFDVATRKIGDKYFDIFVDDCGLFKDSPIVSVVDGGLQPMLVGNCVIANHDSEGETTSLTDDEMEMIQQNIIHIVDFDREVSYPCIMAGY